MIGIQYKIDKKPGLALERRNSILNRVEGLGPPDICYLTYSAPATGLKRLLSTSKTESRFHYIYGNSSLEVSVLSAYFLQFDNTHIVSGTYCIYDLFSRTDFRVEIHIPGTVDHFSLDQNKARQEAEQNIIQGAYISSVLRFFYPQPIAPCRKISPFQSLNDLKTFVEIACLFRDRIGVALGDPKDIIRYSEHVLFHALNKYFLTFKQYKIQKMFYEKIAKKDPLMLYFLAEASLKSGQNTREIRQRIEEQLELTPSSHLQFALAKILLKNYNLEQTERLLQDLIEKNLDNFTYWLEMLKTYIKKQDFSKVLLAINNAPAYEIKEDIHAISFHENSELKTELPLNVDSSSSLWHKPVFYDFRAYNEATVSHNERHLKSRLSNLPATSFSIPKRRLYKCLVEIWNMKDWNFLLSLKSSLFGECDFSYSIPGLSALKTVNHRRNASVSYNRAHRRISSREMAPLDELVLPDFKHVLHEHYSTVNYEEVLNNLRRIETSTLTEIFQALHKDLTELVRWTEESTETESIDRHTIRETPHDGEVWLMRGRLAERLNKDRLAERAYRYAVDKGFSIYGWYRLLRHYTSNCNPKAALTCITELLKQLMHDGIAFPDVLPEWLEAELCKLCTGCGLKQLCMTANEMQLRKFPCIIRTIRKMQYWKVDGTDTKQEIKLI